MPAGVHRRDDRGVSVLLGETIDDRTDRGTLVRQRGEEGGSVGVGESHLS